MSNRDSIPSNGVFKRFVFTGVSGVLALVLLLSYQNCAKQQFSATSDGPSSVNSANGQPTQVREGQTSVITVHLPGPVSSQTDLVWQIPGAEGDVQQTNGTVTLNPGEDSFTIEVKVPANSNVNTDREYSVVVIDPTTGQPISEVPPKTIIVVDTTPKPPVDPAEEVPLVLVTATTCSINEYCTWTFSLSKPFPKDVVFNWYTVKPRSYPAPAGRRWGVEGVDFAKSGGTITIKAGQLTGNQAQVKSLVNEKITIPIDMYPCWYGGASVNCEAMIGPTTLAN